MLKSDPLAQLRDIHLPSALGWWPLAPGWYVLMLIILFLISLLALYVAKRHSHARAKNQALKLLHSYKMQYEQETNTSLISAKISELLRRVALVYYPRKTVASLHGEAWIAFLNQSGKGVDFKQVQGLLLDAPFNKKDRTDLRPLIAQAGLWIKQRGAPCSN